MLDRPLRPSVALTDTNPDPRIVEVQLVATTTTVEYLDGKPAEVWAFQDGATQAAPTIPGPTLIANLGDEVIVHFRNDLPAPTIIHWHGLRLPAMADGSNVTQAQIEPGKSYDYRFVVNDAGSFWYHPHLSSEVQIERGLYGPFIVKGGVIPEVSADRYLVLDDVKLSSDGKLSTKTDALDVMLGRQGNVLLVNGQTGAQLAVSSGSRERWRFVNAANGRYFLLELKGVRFLVIGGDGGLIPEPYEADQLLIAPGERYEVLVTFDAPSGTRLPLQTVHYDRGHQVPDPGPKELLEVVVGPPETKKPAALPTRWATLNPTPVDATTPIRPFVLQEIEGPDETVFLINGQRWPFNQPVMVKQGATEIWEIRNEAEMDHPFHLHGMFFQPVGGRPGWKDTINVPQKSSLQFVVKYEPLGMWMFHCHILEHAERGMMGELMVMP
jgi:FtsP/CotA-like multicopper oxidase with cupredoxin domain